MLGLDPSLGRGELFEEILPALVAQSGADAIYVPSAPCGGDVPFRPERGIANYYGVGGYRRPLDDARRSQVRFAAECLAFSNVPDEPALELGGAAGEGQLAVNSPAWKAGVPRDIGAGWDFEDVRDHYLQELFGVDARELRSIDPSRYLELSRAVSGEVMAEVFGEWRREASPCGGALVLWLGDLAARRRLGPAGLTRRAEGRLPPPQARARADRGLDRGRGARRCGGARRQRHPRPPARRPEGGALPRPRAEGRGGHRERRAGAPQRPGAQRRGDARALRRCRLGIPLRPSRPRPDRGEPGARDRRRPSAALTGGAVPRRPARRAPHSRRPRPAGAALWSWSTGSRRSWCRADSWPMVFVCTCPASQLMRTPSRSSPGASARYCFTLARRGQEFAGGKLSALNLAGRMPIESA